MKKIATKLITISSQILIVSLFLVLLFSNGKENNEVIIVSNDNFNKMADSVSFLFKKEEMMLNTDDGTETLLEEDTKGEEEEKKSDNEVKETKETKKEDPPVNDTKEEEKPSTSVTPLEDPVLETYVGNLTGYGADCYGCSGRTRSGWDLRKSIYYEDSEYGTVRIIAADSSFGKNAIFRISNVPGMDPFIAIVLDTGGNVGFNKGTLFDLAYTTESDPNLIGLTRNVTFELLRRGISW